MPLESATPLAAPPAWLPQRHAVSVDIGPAEMPDGGGWSAAVRLRDRVRAWMLPRCGEPDLQG